MVLNLGNAADFAKATLSSGTSILSSASGILNQFAGLNSQNWNIQESAYGHLPNPLVVFHVFSSPVDYAGAVDQVQDNIARRVPVFEFPYIDGQTTDDLGRKGESYDFNILLFGVNYYAAYKKLIAEFNNPLPGTLVHPVRGRMRVKFESATVIHKSNERQAVTLRARFVEHNFEVSFQDSKATTKSALATAVGFIGVLNNILNKINSNLNVLSQVRAILAGKSTAYSANYTATLVAMNTTFNSGTSSDIPSLLPNNPSNGNTNTVAFPSAESPTDPFSSITPAQIQAEQSPALAANQAIGRVSALRVVALDLITSMEAVNGGQGALIFYDDILNIKQSALAMQQVLALGIQTSNASIKNYTLPILMTIREVCFANNISVDRMEELMTLNPSILSANYITAGTVLQVPTS